MATTNNKKEILEELSLPSLMDTTIDSNDGSDGMVTEDRLVNKAELDKLGLFSYAFCVICQELIMPQAKKPVICSICQTAVYCKPCI